MGSVYLPHELFIRTYPKYLGQMGVRFRLPILDWTESEVFDWLGNGLINPLYSMGFDRVGCFPCLASGDTGMVAAFSFGAFGADQRKIVVQLEEQVGESVFQSGVGRRFVAGSVEVGSEIEGGGCAICAM